jgi:hypothetical protein
MLREVYHPMFDMYGVDLVFQAHDHNYERSYPITYNKDESSNPIIVHKNDSYNKTTTNSHGTVFATVGTGGGELNKFEGKAPYMAKQFTGFGFLNIEITDGRSLSGNFIANNGTTVDDFKINK